jgi:uncharacterized integral membrane protein
VKDDDLDLELDDEPVVKERKPAPAAKPVAASPAPTVKPVEPVGERKGWRGGIVGSVARAKAFRWDLKTFVYLLLGIVLLVIFIENWVPVRFYALGLTFEIPRTVAFVIDMAIGAALMWLWLRRGARSEGEEAGE